VDGSLSQHYDRAIAAAVGLSGVSEGELRRWFSDCLISGAGMRRIVLAEDESTERLPKAALEVLKEQRVIRAEAHDGCVWYELTHDRFIEPVQTSNRAWLERRAPAEALRRKLESKAAVAGARLDELELREAEQFLQMPEAERLGITDAVKAFVRASRERVDQDNRHKERKLEDARKLAAWASFATQLAISSEEAKRRAQSLKAAWRGVNLAPEKLDLALLLTAEAFRRGGGQEAKNALLTSLLASPQLNSFLRGHSPETTVRGLAFSPNGETLASADGNGMIILWYPDSGFMVREPIRAHKEYIYSIAFSPDGRYLASASRDKTVALADVASGAVERLVKDAEFHFRRVAFSPDGKMLAAACRDGSVRRWNIAQKTALRAGEKPVFQSIASLIHHDRQAAPRDVPVNAVALQPG
jgi:hypothetical protein